MWFLRRDPGPCPVCGAEHTACTATPGPPALAVAQLPARDAAHPAGASPSALPAGTGVRSPAPAVAVPARAPLRSEEVQASLGPNSFTTATYRRKARR